MMRNEQQVINGIVSYIDGEVMPKMSTIGKWVVGAWSIMAMDRAEHIVHSFLTNPVVSSLCVVDDNGLVDMDKVVGAMRSAAGKYGTMYIDIPLIGRMSFTSDDVSRLGEYINRQ